MSDSIKISHNTFSGHNHETQFKESNVVMAVTNVTIMCEKLKNDFLFGNGRRGKNRFKKRLRKLPSNSSRFSLIES